MPSLAVSGSNENEHKKLVTNVFSVITRVASSDQNRQASTTLESTLASKMCHSPKVKDGVENKCFTSWTRIL